MPITLLGLEDAAFFPYENGHRPTNGPEGIKAPINTPQFDVLGINADQKINYYQTRGNWMGFTVRDVLWWSSSCLGKEVHGIINGWTDAENINLDDCISVATYSEKKHTEAGKIGVKRNKKVINGLLNTCRA